MLRFQLEKSPEAMAERTAVESAASINEPNRRAFCVRMLRRPRWAAAAGDPVAEAI
jgi:hypothetical protein